MKKLLLPVCIFLFFGSYAQLNIQFRSNIPYPGLYVANIGGYVDHLGNEYALVGYQNGLDIVDVTNPDTPVVKFTVAGPSSEWREVKKYRDFAYITTENGSVGLQIVDLSSLPGTYSVKTYKGDSVISGQINTIHALHIDTAKAYCYLYGSNISTGANRNGYPLILDISDPWNPHYAGQFIISSGDAYVHDGYVQNDTAYYCHIYGGFVSIVDERNKSNPVLLATQATPNNFPHNTWLSDNHKTVFTTDETSNSYLTAYDISDLSNIQELSRFQTDPGSNSIVHNTHILNDYAITSWYTEGVVIVDESNPNNPIEVGHYDTYPANNSSGFHGDWGVYPFLPSGNLVVSDIDGGLFVLTPTYMRGCYLEGTVTDSITGNPIINANVQVLTAPIVKNSDLSGNYKTGIGSPGTYSVQVSKAGYNTKVMNGVLLSTGLTTVLNIPLTPLTTFAYTGSVVDTPSNSPIPFAQVEMWNADFTFDATCDASGNFTIPDLIPGTYTITAGKWGFQNRCITLSSVTSSYSPLTIKLSIGYYDDFNLDLGWTVSGPSPNKWERGIPIGTKYGSQFINPNVDVTVDCGSKCYVTDNGGGGPADHDVDNGHTILTSPVFDATIYTNPSVDYFRWFVDLSNGHTANDSMTINLFDGTTITTLETITSASGGQSSWLHRSHAITNPTSTMQLIVDIGDVIPDDTLEGGFDRFLITGTLVGLPTINGQGNASHLDIYGNPFSGKTVCNWFIPSNDKVNADIIIADLLGKTVESHHLSSASGEVEIGNNLNEGIYFVALKNKEGIIQTKRVVKIENGR